MTNKTMTLEKDREAFELIVIQSGINPISRFKIEGCNFCYDSLFGFFNRSRQESQKELETLKELIVIHEKHYEVLFLQARGFQKELETLKARISALEANLFNSDTHCELLRENYDSAFEFFADNKKADISVVFEEYKQWLISGNKDNFNNQE